MKENKSILNSITFILICIILFIVFISAMNMDLLVAYMGRLGENPSFSRFCSVFCDFIVAVFKTTFGI